VPRAFGLLLLICIALGCDPVLAAGTRTPPPAQIDARVERAMAGSGVQGLAIAVIDSGQIRHVRSYGRRNEKGDPLTTSTIMYGASLTKTVFAYTVAQMAQEGVLDLDRPIAEMLARPLPDYPGEEDRYAPWESLAGEDRWRRLTPRLLLNHGSGFANFYFLEPDNRLHMHFDPGSRYGYSGDGYILLQFVLERGLGQDLGQEMQERVFRPLGMTRTSMMWRPDFATDLADGWKLDGSVEPHDERSATRASGSMDTTIADFARFAEALVSGAGLSPDARRDMTRPQLAITTRTQFPTLQPELPPQVRRPDLAAGLGLIVFRGPQGPGFFKGGHNDSTANTFVCVEARKACVVLLSNDVRAEALFPDLVRFVLGETGVPWDWEYGPQSAP